MAKNQRKHGRLIVVTGPSGVGKGTLLNAIFQSHPDLHFSVSATTRPPRPNEIEGQHYYFLTPEIFENKVQRSEFLEWATFAGNCYGTPKEPILKQVEKGTTVILEIELEGARQVRKTAPEAIQIFILPPSIDELESRIRSRAQDEPEAIARRLDRAKVEIAAASEFDYTITNDDLESATLELKELIFPSGEAV
ncbi:MAG: guanylate kinase [Cyanobacteria bacterium P01_F01_bin.42]